MSGELRTGFGLLVGAALLSGCAATEIPDPKVPDPKAPVTEAPVITEVPAAKPETPAAPALTVAPPPPARAIGPELTPVDPSVYAARKDGNRTLKAIDVGYFHSGLLRNRLAYETTEAPGTLVVDTKGPFLYLVEPDGMATRYGIAIGKEGFGWKGKGVIARTARWPTWTPPPEMIKRDPDLKKWRAGMPGGTDNPLGARALYIYFGGSDSGYRIHGTNQPKSIGRAASSGCFRMLNQDVIDLYERVERGAKVVVL